MVFYKKYLFVVFITSILISQSLSVYSQENSKGPEIFLSPRITLGYTFGSGLNYGFDVVLGLYQVGDFKFGTNFTYYMANTEQGHHSIKGFGIVAEMDYFSIKLGAGSVSRRWGLKNINKAKAPGLMVDLSAGVDPYRAPWIGFKSFLFSREKWTFYDQPSYISAYTYFKSSDIEIFKEEETVPNQ